MTEKNLALYDTQTKQVLEYPRVDDEPIQQLDPRYVVLKIVRKPEPQPIEGYTVRPKRKVNVRSKKWIWDWELVPIVPTVDWDTFRRELTLRPQINSVLRDIRELAVKCRLPEQVILAFSGESLPVAEFVGQEWEDGDGILWRVVQARGYDGQFLPDDPETPARESLTWTLIS